MVAVVVSVPPLLRVREKRDALPAVRRGAGLEEGVAHVARGEGLALLGGEQVVEDVAQPDLLLGRERSGLRGLALAQRVQVGDAVLDEVLSLGAADARVALQLLASAAAASAPPT